MTHSSTVKTPILGKLILTQHAMSDAQHNGSLAKHIHTQHQIKAEKK